MEPMTMTHPPQEVQQLLIELNADPAFIEWVKGKSWKEVYETCHKGNWLLWLFAKINPNNIRETTLVNGYCANTIRHLIKKNELIYAVDACIAFGFGEITLIKLCGYNISGVEDAAMYADVYTESNEGYTAKKQNQQSTADICRKYLPIELWNISPKKSSSK